MPRLLTEAEVCRYEREGIVFPIPVLSSREIDCFRADCDRLEEQLGGKPRTIELRQMHLHFSWAYELAIHPRILDAVEDLLGPNVLIWATELFAKHAQSPTVSISWHRDRPYMGLRSGQSTTAWVALTNSSVANGCMRALPRSVERDAPAQQSGLDRYPGVMDIVLNAGSMSLHDADILHGSGPNASSEKRVGFVVRYITPSCVPHHGKPPVALARGCDPFGQFEIVGPPRPINDQLALTEMRASAARHLDAVLQNLKGSQGAPTSFAEKSP